MLRRLFTRWQSPTAESTPAPSNELTPSSRSLNFNPAHPDYVNDPYPLLHDLRLRDPIHRNDKGLWVITRYSDVAALLDDPSIGNAPSAYAVVAERNRHKYVCADVANNILPFQDPPQHTLPRRLISRTFLQHIRGQTAAIQSITEASLSDISAQSEIDLLADFATPLSLRVMTHFLGLTGEDEQALKRWSEWFFYLFMPITSQENRQTLDQNLHAFREVMHHQLDLRRQRPRDDLITRLLDATEGGTGLTDEQVVDTLMLLFADGIENVDSLIATTAWLLLSHPDQLDQLDEKPELIASAIEEALRFESPAQYIGRVAKEDVELHGRLIKRNSGLLLVLASANRDEDAFTFADQFDITRHPNPYLSFGRGRHACIGASLAKSVAEVAVGALLPHLRGFELDKSTTTWMSRPGHRWLRELPIKRCPAAGR
ncbi:MAG: cytochrome P450 [Pseudomonadota bacterium]